MLNRYLILRSSRIYKQAMGGGGVNLIFRKLALQYSGAMRPRLNALRTIRAQIFIGFVAMSVLTGALGAFGIYATSRAGHIVVDIYDRPLMAINFARSAASIFAQMENDVLQARLSGNTSVETEPLAELSQNFFEDLTVAQQRSMSAAAAGAAVEIRQLVQQWLAATRDAPGDTTALSAQILKQFDRLFELAAEDGFRERQRSLGEISTTLVVAIGCTLLALFVSGMVTFVLARRILRPLSAAAAVADRIAQGELTVEIPQGRHDEVGRLLRSMHSMQSSIRAMMAEEVEQRRSAQRRLVDAIEGSQEAMILVGADGQIVIANSQVKRFLPLAAEALVASAQFEEAIAQAVSPGLVSNADGAVDDPSIALSTEGEVRIGNELWLKVSRGTTQDGGIFLFWSDISAIKEREQRLSEAKADAEAANRSKGAFLANMSHELRTPLNAIIGFSEMIKLALRGPVPATYREYGGLIHQSGEHLLAVINDILDLAKADAGKFELSREAGVDPRRISESCLTLVRPHADFGEIELTLAADDALPMLVADPTRLKQMLLNLLSNAIKFTNPAGSVTLAVRGSENGGVIFEVRDTGVGMTPSEIETALEPFGQVRDSTLHPQEGTGLGLPLARQFAELHGGTLYIASKKGSGTTATVTLPTSSDKEQQAGLRDSARDFLSTAETRPALSQAPARR
jgi:two-component system cell cycle sensor histidine kinase PleC